MPNDIKIITTGGTIDKVYFDANSQFEVGNPTIEEILKIANVTFSYEIVSPLRKDSLELTDEDRKILKSLVTSSPEKRILITHGTDTMADTAKYLGDIKGKVIVFTGSMQPARIQTSDAIFNVGTAISAVQVLEAGVYIVINGRVFRADKVQKNLDLKQFQPKEKEALVLSEL